MAKIQIKKTYLKSWVIKNFYKYNLYEVDANGNKWLEANPVTPGLVTRCADDEYVLRIMLENDCESRIKFIQRVR